MHPEDYYKHNGWIKNNIPIKKYILYSFLLISFGVILWIVLFIPYLNFQKRPLYSYAIIFIIPFGFLLMLLVPLKFFLCTPRWVKITKEGVIFVNQIGKTFVKWRDILYIKPSKGMGTEALTDALTEAIIYYKYYSWSAGYVNNYTGKSGFAVDKNIGEIIMSEWCTWKNREKPTFNPQENV